MSEENIVVLGAGPAGMASAFELCKTDRKVTVIEKNETVGGLSRTLQYGEFRTDLGPHRFFSQNQYLYDLIEDVLGERWIKVDRLTRFYVNNRFFLYPIEFKDALLNIGLHKAFSIIFDYSYERFKKIFINSKPVSFEEKIISDFGRALAELNMLNYTEKIWGLPCSEISTDWASQRIRGLSITAVLKKALKKKQGKGPKTLVDQFFYPDLGTYLIYEEMKNRISKNDTQEKNCSFKFNSYPVKIFHGDNKINKVLVRTKDGEESIIPAQMISTIPITEFVDLLEPGAPVEVSRAVRNLKFRSHVSLFITLNKPSVFPDQWVYLPDKEIPFGRIMEPKNFSKKMAPADKTSLLVEFFCWENDKIWNSGREELFKLAIKWLERLDFIKEKEVIEYYIHKEKYAYPVYDLNYREHLEKTKDYLNKFKNLIYTGRSGSFRYNNQDHALKMGILAAKSIMHGNRYDLEGIGTEQEYFERGYVRSKKE